MFFTDEICRDGEDVEATVLRLLDFIAEAKLTLDISCHVPPSIYDEHATMLEDRGVSEEVFSKLNTWVIKKRPSRFEVTVPAEIVFEFIDEMSDRVNRGFGSPRKRSARPRSWRANRSKARST